jgi:hypothetical protein
MAMVPMDTTTLLEAKSESRGGCRPEGGAVGCQGRCRTDSSGRWTLMVSPLPLAMPLSITTKSVMPGRLAAPRSFLR